MQHVACKIFLNFEPKWKDPSLVILACGVVVTLLLRGANRRCRIRIIWIRDWIRNYQYYGAYHHLVKLVTRTPTEMFFRSRMFSHLYWHGLHLSCRCSFSLLLMDSSTFEELLSLVGPQIPFHDTHLREVH